MGSSSTTITNNKLQLALRLPQVHAKKKQQQQQVPKGCLAVQVGEAGGEQQRFVVPVICFNHPLFMQLLKEAEDEYGFEQKGTIIIPCDVQYFRTIVSRIHDHHHHHHFGCFRVWAS